MYTAAMASDSTGFAARAAAAALAALLGLAACGGGGDPAGNAGASSGLYLIDRSDVSAIKFRMIDSLNALRAREGLQPVVYESRLTAAAATHALDMSRQNRPWHYGSDGSSPIDRAAKAGYPGRLVGETISETYESELQTLVAWMGIPAARRVLMAPQAQEMGFAWLQEKSGRIWWSLVMGDRTAAALR